MEIVCSECGRVVIGAWWKVSRLDCDFCKKVTKWTTKYRYKKETEKKRHGNRFTVNR